MKTAPICATLALMLALAACGNGPDAGKSNPQMMAIKAAFSAAVGAPDTRSSTGVTGPAAVAARQILEQDGQPIITMRNTALRFFAFMAPLGDNGPVRTWSTEAFETVALRDGIVMATRGLGNDLMSAESPTAAQIARGTGVYQRTYYLLDGADQTVKIAAQCDLQSLGAEVIDVLGRSYSTRKIAENCGINGKTVTNTYWFDRSSHVLQSQQWISPQVGQVLIQSIVD